MRMLGVGCVWLDYAEAKEIDNTTRSGEEVSSDLIKALESLDSVTNVRLLPATDREVYWHGAEVTQATGDNRIIPIFPNRWISFDIYLPERVQRQIGDGRFCGVETFHVDMYFAYYMPVTYVSYVADETAAGASPSTAVVIIRRFLEQKLPSTSEFVSGCVGPGPFHANFFLIEDPSHTGMPQVADVSDDLGGYSTYGLVVPPCDDVPVMLGRLNDVLSSFYALSVNRANILRRSTKV